MKTTLKVVIATGGFDPIHSGHIEYLNKAKALGDLLVVGINSDEWLRRKKGKEFLSSNEREIILSNLKSVDKVITFDDRDNSAKDAIIKTRALYPTATILFVNGGDRTKTNIPEMDVKDDNVEFVFGVGGEDKKNSSSWILKKWNEK
jgi:cytidyltransferase-like protein